MITTETNQQKINNSKCKIHNHVLYNSKAIANYCVLYTVYCIVIMCRLRSTVNMISVDHRYYIISIIPALSTASLP